MKKNHCLIPAFCLALILAGSACATTVNRLELKDLVRRAKTIVVGKVTGSRTYWSPDRKLILTDYAIAVSESIKGRPGRTISVTTAGGKIGDVELHVSGMPTFQNGEDAVVFIQQTGPYQTVLGLAQGKFRVTNGEVSNSVGGLAFADGRPGASTRMPVENFKNEIRKLLNR